MMICIFKNGYTKVFKTGINVDDIKELLFTKDDTKDIQEIFSTTEFKYRPISEYIFTPLTFYKTYTCSTTGKQNIVRLLDGEVQEFKDMLKISEILENHYSFDEIMGFGKIEDIIHFSDEVAFDEENYTIGVFTDDECGFMTISVEIRYPVREIMSDYREMQKEKDILKLIHNLQPILSDRELDLTKKCLYKNYDTILNEVERFDVTIKELSSKDVGEFAKLATANTYELNHSWAGSKYNTVEFDLLYGNVKFGIDSKYEYSNNGEMDDPTIAIELPSFDVDEPSAFLRRDHNYDGYNRNDTSESDTSYTLVVYTGR